MAIKIVIANKLVFAVKGTLNIDGQRQDFDFELTAERLGADGIKTLVETQDRSVEQELSALITGWSRVQDADGSDVPFSQDRLAQLFQIPGLAQMVMMEYLDNVRVKAKN